MEELPPFDLVPLDDGRSELRAFSDDSEDPITIPLDPESGRQLVAALGDALSSLGGLDPAAREFHVRVGQRLITIMALPGRGVRLTVSRGSG